MARILTIFSGSVGHYKGFTRFVAANKISFDFFLIGIFHRPPPGNIGNKRRMSSLVGRLPYSHISKDSMYRALFI